MRLPRPRFTVRRLMVAVAIVGLGLGWIEVRRKQFTSMALDHYRKFREPCDEEGFGVSSTPPISEERRVVLRERDAYHQAMCDKYHQAARDPWLPVTHDPPEPE
jgi:hypothetical protein